MRVRSKSELEPNVTRIVMVWVAGLVTIVPYAVYYLFFHASSDQYAWLITFVLFWIFGFWGVVGPIVAALRVRRLFKAIERAGSSEELKKVIQSNESREAAIELIASENGIPKVLARPLYRWIERRRSGGAATPARRVEGEA